MYHVVAQRNNVIRGIISQLALLKSLRTRNNPNILSLIDGLDQDVLTPMINTHLEGSLNQIRSAVRKKS